MFERYAGMDTNQIRRVRLIDNSGRSWSNAELDTVVPRDFPANPGY